MNLGRLQQLSSSYHLLRRYSDEAAINDRAFIVAPKDTGVRQVRSQLYLDARADTRPLHETLATILSEDPSAAESIADGLLISALCERDTAAAERALAAISSGGVGLSNLQYPRAYAEGLIARTLDKDPTRAQSAFARARAEQEKTVLADKVKAAQDRVAALEQEKRHRESGVNPPGVHGTVLAVNQAHKFGSGSV